MLAPCTQLGSISVTPEGPPNTTSSDPQAQRQDKGLNISRYGLNQINKMMAMLKVAKFVVTCYNSQRQSIVNIIIYRV